ncbi:hypothetical protein C0J52_21404 [Blattella germanica]|nr:hypothetical protein C0J52_21404 [Blattella germanica]
MFQFGGPGCMVQVNESVVPRRKYNGTCFEVKFRRGMADLVSDFSDIEGDWNIILHIVAEQQIIWCLISQTLKETGTSFFI